jgi:hypothetical protein
MLTLKGALRASRLAAVDSSPRHQIESPYTVLPLRSSSFLSQDTSSPRAQLDLLPAPSYCNRFVFEFSLDIYLSENYYHFHSEF